MKPVIVINAKTYLESTGENALGLIQICEEVIKKTGADIGFAAQEPDLLAVGRVTNKTKIYAQHVDPGEPGRNTGFVLAKNMAALGISHTILNHSEHKLSWEKLVETLKLCKELRMTTVVCADTVEEARKVAALGPSFVAVEPPELIGGNISVSTANPEIIRESKKAVGTVPLLVGAGIKNGEDVRIAMSLGAVGVLVASGVVLAPYPQKALLDLIG